MRVVFLGPSYPQEMQQFTRGLAEVGAEIYGVGDTPPSALPRRLRSYLAGYLEVPRLLAESDVIERTSAWLRGREIDRVLSAWEPTVLTAAKLRERWGVPGMRPDTVRGFRDKQLMKERVAAAGVRVPRAERADPQRPAKTAEPKPRRDARGRRGVSGFPVILKPIAGAGSADTYQLPRRGRARDRGILQAPPTSASSASRSTSRARSSPTTRSASDGDPGLRERGPVPAQAPRGPQSEEWISPVIITVRDLEQAKIQRRRRSSVARCSGPWAWATASPTWSGSYTPKGEAVFGEIGCRPGGARLVDQMNYTSDIDLFREWARAVCWKSFEAPTTRKYNCGIIFKRARGQGRITRIAGLDTFKRRYGGVIVEDELLRPGTPRRDWKATLVSDGFLMVRHPDWDICKQICASAATDITMYAE